MKSTKSNLEILQEKFNLKEFRYPQAEIIESLLNGNNTLCLMPTGLGKSVIFQLAGYQQNTTVLVISPLLALMNQQVEKLNNLGLNSVAINSDTGDSKKQYNILLDIFKNKSNPRFLYLSPEKLFLDGYLEYILHHYRSEIGLVVIDEVHCVSQWGYNFRPSYKMIVKFLENIFGLHGVPTYLCLTATLNGKDKEEICHEFNIREGNVISSKSLLRDNIKLIIEDELKNKTEKEEKLKQILDRHSGEKIIVYTHIKAYDYGTKKMADKFNNLGYNCRRFDADLSPDDKNENMNAFISGETEIIFATSAFGMGIDIPDIRVIVHYLVPESIEQYYQEVGRCGRDGKPSFAYLLYSDANFKVRNDLIEDEFESIEDMKSVFYEKLWHRRYDNENPYSYCSIGMNYQGDDKKDFILFYFLLKHGFVDLIEKGFSSINCFKELIPSNVYHKIEKVSPNGLLEKIAKNSNTPIEQITQGLYDELFSNIIKLERSPEKTLYYRIPNKLTDEDFQLLLDDIRERTKYRKEGFDKFKDMIINHRDDVLNIIDKHLG